MVGINIAVKHCNQILFLYIFMFKNRRFKHIYNDGNDIGRRKQQKLALCSHVNFLSHTSQCQQFYVFIHIYV